MAGHVTPAGVVVTVGAARRPLPATAERLADWAAGVLPCPHCGERFGCDCVDWLEWMLRADDDYRRACEEETADVA